MTEEGNFNNLLIALLNCFVMILSGYIAGRLNIITPSQSIGISKFVGYFALPTLLFKNMVELNFETVTWSLVLAIFIAKSMVFALVFGMTMLVGGKKLGKAGLYAIFATQSNDFAMGYPIVQVLYGETYPEIIQYIYLLAPVQLLILNPIGFLFLEIGEKNGDSSSTLNPYSSENGTENCGANENRTCGKWKVVKEVILGVIKNPIVAMVFIGLLFHFVFSGKLPAALDSIVTTPSNAFAATALFYLGLTMVGKISSQKGPGLFITACLVFAKVLLLPVLARWMMYLLSTDDLQQPGMSANSTTNITYRDILDDFAYLYGTIPTAPSVIIFATQYQIEIDRMATSMVACTALSAPIMYISAWSLTYATVSSDYFDTLILSTYSDISYISIVCNVWCIFIFVFGKKFQRVPHSLTLVLTGFFLWTAIFAAISVHYVHGYSPEQVSMVLFAMMYFGIACSRFLTASLAVCLMLLDLKGDDAVRKMQKYMIGAPIALAVCWTLIVSIGGTSISVLPLNYTIGNSGLLTLTMSLVMLGASLLVTAVALVVIFRRTTRKHSEVTETATTVQPSAGSSERKATIGSSEGTEDDDDSNPAYDDDEGAVLIGDVADDSSEASLQSTTGSHEFTRHVCLLMILSVSMLVGIVMSTWKIEDSEVTGSYTELAFVDAVLSVGQGIFVFLIFGFDNELIIEPISKLYRKARGKGKEVELPAWSKVSGKSLKTCALFKYHYEQCRSDIEKSQRRSIRNYEKSFSGNALVNWLINAQLVTDRCEAVDFAEDLIIGRVMRHVHNQYHFHDTSYKYQFIEPKTAQSQQPTTSACRTAPQATSECEVFEFENHLVSVSPTSNFNQRNHIRYEEGAL